MNTEAESIAPRSICFFLYGTLCAGGEANAVLAECDRLGEAWVAGTLYDINGRFPALVLYGTSTVRGEIWRCPDALLPRLDEYEGVAAGLFRRVALRAGEHACWTYVAGPALARELTTGKQMRGGDWRARASR